MIRKESKSRTPILLSTFLSMTLLSTSIVQAETVSQQEAEVDTVSENIEDIEIDELPNNDDLDQGDEQPEEGTLRMMNALPDAAEIYNSVIKAKYAYVAWDEAQLFKELYPDDSKLQSAIDTAAGYILNQGIISHRNKNYSKAVEIYETVLGDESVSDWIYNPTRSYHTQALNQQELRTEEDLYDSIVNAKFAYIAWDEAQLFKELYPNDSRLQNALDTAASYIINQGIISHRNRNYSKAVEIYEKVLSDESVSEWIYYPTRTYRTQALNQKELLTGDDLYDSIVNAEYAYVAWDEAQLFKELYPNKKRVQESVNIAADYNLRQGILSYERENYESAINIFNKIIDEPLVNSTSSKTAQKYKNNSIERLSAQQANDLYDSIINAQFAYKAWDQVQVFKKQFPQDERLQEAIDVAVGYNLSQGIKSHQNSNFEQANEVYTKILLEELVDPNVSNKIKSLASLATQSIKFHTADDLFDSIINAKFAYEAWEDAQLFKGLYPQDKRLEEAIEVAAGYNFKQGVKSHQANNFEKANEIYSKILSESLVSSSISETTKVLLSLSEKSTKLISADELYNSVIKAKFAYAAWDDAQMFKLLV